MLTSYFFVAGLGPSEVQLGTYSISLVSRVVGQVPFVAQLAATYCR